MSDVIGECYGKRTRATKAEMGDRCINVWELVKDIYPATLRQCFYQAIVRAFAGIEKNLSGYNKVQRLIAFMRTAPALYSPLTPTCHFG